MLLGAVSRRQAGEILRISPARPTEVVFDAGT
jgi:hypothetical protein